MKPLPAGRGVWREKDVRASAVADVRAIYAELSERPQTRDCIGRAQCCQFHLTGRMPYLTKGEAIVAWEGWRATGRKHLPTVTSGICPFLDRASLRCLIYESRPFGCRTHFCAAAGGPYARKEVSDLIHRLEDQDAALGGDGPRKLPVALGIAAN